MSQPGRYEPNEYHRGCPICGLWDGRYDIGRGEWTYCVEHRLKWCEGAGRAHFVEGDEEKRAAYERLCERYGVDTFQDADDPFREE